MTIRLADLHMHTYYSDGTQSPEEVIDEAFAQGISCIAITDHDVLDAIDPALDYASTCDMEVIPAIELSTRHNNRNVDMLGYFINHRHGPIVDKLHDFQDAREQRMRDMIDALKNLGIDDIKFGDVAEMSPSRSLGRPHLAMKLVEKGWVSSTKEAFDRYLNDAGPVVFPKFDMAPTEAIDLIHASGGLAVMAHPIVTQQDDIIPALVEAGLDGLEVYYANSTEAAIVYYKGIARKHDLLMTGGSDAHGTAKENTWLGKKTIPYEFVAKMKERMP